MAGYDTPLEIATGFIDQRPARKTLATMFKYSTNQLVSYGSHFPLIIRESDGSLLVNMSKYSPTTNRHVTACQRAALQCGYQDMGEATFELDNPMGDWRALRTYTYHRFIKI